eukprot:jgi/Hompol1/1097/HPOL_001630-RA
MDGNAASLTRAGNRLCRHERGYANQLNREQQVHTGKARQCEAAVFVPTVCFSKLGQWQLHQNISAAKAPMDFFTYINLFFGSVSDFCSPSACPVMHGGVNYEYSWIDSQKRSLKLPAPQYTDYVMAWVQNLVNDESIFPTKAGEYSHIRCDIRLLVLTDCHDRTALSLCDPDGEFPKDFQATVKLIFKQLFRVLAHIYHAHYDIILHLSSEAHLNTLFAHFVCFAREFDLLDKKEMAPMAEFIVLLEESGRI